MDDGDVVTLVTVAVDDAASDDAFDALADQTVSVTTTDDDTAAFTIVESGGTTVVAESGTTDDFTVVLGSEPVANVVLNVSSGDVGEATVNASSLICTSATWDTPQTVTVTGVDDAIDDDDQVTDDPSAHTVIVMVNAFAIHLGVMSASRTGGPPRWNSLDGLGAK